jgi:glycogen synthase
MKIAMLTNEYPPNVYGGAGVHVQYLTRGLAAARRKDLLVSVFCFGKQKEKKKNLEVTGVTADIKSSDGWRGKILDILERNLTMASLVREADVVHCHTWYTHFAGTLMRELLGVPLVLTTHSLEPCRPWKQDQLGSAYRISCRLESEAYMAADGVIAVSEAMKKDVQDYYGVRPEKIRVIHNGIDVNEFRPVRDNRKKQKVLRAYGIDPGRPFVLFVGRVTKQKGILYLLMAGRYFVPALQVVICAGEPDTEETWKEAARMAEEVRTRSGREIIFIREQVPREKLLALLSAASVYVSPSIYEPFGIGNLEAMACETPVVASKVGGIPEAVRDGKTGILVAFEGEQQNAREGPADPDKFARNLAEAVNYLIENPDKRRRMGVEGRKWVEKHFSWRAIADETLRFYDELAGK